MRCLTVAKSGWTTELDDLLTRAYNFWVHEQPREDPDGFACQRCKLQLDPDVSSQVFGDGDADSKLVIIGEAPGEQEDRFTTPFVGPAGQLIRKEAAKVGVDLGHIDLGLDPKLIGPSGTTQFRAVCSASFGCAYWTNTVACRPPKNRPPEADEMEACAPRLDMIMAAIRPRVILVVGATALTQLTGKLGITRNRGKLTGSRWVWKGQTYNIPVLPTFHPAGLLPGRLKQPGDLELFRQDIRAAYDLAYPNGWPE